MARLAPFLPQLAFAIRRRAGDLPPALKVAGSHGERHIATLVCLGIVGPATVSELARRLDMSAAHASLVVGDLARSGLVERDHDDKDRRRIVVSLSEVAKPAVAAMRERNAAALVRFLKSLDDDEAERFIDHLAELVACLNGTARGVPRGPSLVPLKASPTSRSCRRPPRPEIGGVTWTKFGLAELFERGRPRWSVAWDKVKRTAAENLTTDGIGLATAEPLALGSAQTAVPPHGSQCLTSCGAPSATSAQRRRPGDRPRSRPCTMCGGRNRTSGALFYANGLPRGWLSATGRLNHVWSPTLQ